MDFAIKTFRALRIGWNKKPIGEIELARLARRKKVKIQEMPLRVPGFYMTMRGISFIAVDERLDEKLKLKIKLHEIAHHILHTGKPHFYLLDPEMKEECEAELFAMCCLIPRKWFRQKTIQDLTEIEGFTMDELHYRRELRDKHKV